MSEELELEILASTSGEQVVCPLCGATVELLSAAGLLWDARKPLGCLCERCLITGPRPAASRVRERACALRDLVDHARANLEGDQWLIITEAIRERAAHWEDLADRLRGQGWWRLKKPDESPL